MMDLDVVRPAQLLWSRATGRTGPRVGQVPFDDPGQRRRVGRLYVPTRLVRLPSQRAPTIPFGPEVIDLSLDLPQPSVRPVLLCARVILIAPLPEIALQSSP